jgi:4,5-DOPA dioxygenase extradiol
MTTRNETSNNNNQRMPAIFIGHGSPMNVVQRNGFTESLTELGRSLPKPKAILVISAHWLTEGTSVTCMEKPRTIHDFYGFPEELYAINYPSPGAPSYAQLVIKSVRSTKIKGDTDWGLDHASWAVLKHMYPKADTPVFEMSLDYSFNDWHPKPLQYHYQLGSQLAELRNSGILIIGSGNIVHNLRQIDFEQTDAEPYDWAVEFDQNVKAALLNGNHKDLLNYQNLGESASYAIPTLDHYLPMIYVISLQRKDEPLTFTHEGFQNASISMRCFKIG